MRTNNRSAGVWTGSGSVLVTNTPGSVFSLSTNLSGYSGTLTLGSTASSLRFNAETNRNDCTGSAAAAFDLGAGSGRLENFNGAGLTYDIGALSGGSSTVLAGRSSNAVIWAATSTYRIGGKGVDSTFDGSIRNGTGLDVVSVVKVGSAKLTLNGVNTHTGLTTVSNGTLGGNGSFAGPLTVVAGATLAPGSSVGTLTVSNTATLAGATIMELNRVGTVSSGDKLVANAITAGGTLLVTNIGPTIANGATFQLFSVPVSGFSSITLPGAPYVWATNLTANGSITLVSGGTNLVNTTPTNITSSVSGGTLTLSWPAGHTGWTLQVQTNSLAVGLSNNWVAVPGSAATNQVSVTISPADPTIFYRLVYP
jgi:autotransporter-associated beta strand protein